MKQESKKRSPTNRRHTKCWQVKFGHLFFSPRLSYFKTGCPARQIFEAYSHHTRHAHGTPTLLSQQSSDTSFLAGKVSKYQEMWLWGTYSRQTATAPATYARLINNKYCAGVTLRYTTSSRDFIWKVAIAIRVHNSWLVLSGSEVAASNRTFFKWWEVKKKIFICSKDNVVNQQKKSSKRLK